MHLTDKVTIEHYTIPNIRNGMVFSDLDRPLNASRGFVGDISAEFLVTFAVCMTLSYASPGIKP